MIALTITLTGRAPVKIDRDEWPVLASAQDDKNDDRNNIESQANRTWDWRVTVRKHADGRIIVYARYQYDTHYQGESGANYRRGELLESGVDPISAIQRVCADMEKLVDDGVFARLAHECIAHLPAEQI